jgi:hypothetical protein
MNLPIPLLAIGAILLIVGLIVLPATAANPVRENSAGYGGSMGDHNLHQHWQGAVMQSGSAPSPSSTHNNGKAASLLEMHQNQYRQRTENGATEDTSSSLEETYSREGYQKRKGDVMDRGNGNQDRTRSESHLRDGSCGNCPNL